MISYKTYLSRYPQVSKLRAERFMNGTCYFLKNGYDKAYFPENGSCSNMVCVDFLHLTCECNVFRTRQACPHIAAALGLIEKNGGNIPYSDPKAMLYASLENLKKTGSSTYGFMKHLFLQCADVCSPSLTDPEITEFLLELARCMENPGFSLSRDDFDSCISYFLDARKHDVIFSPLYQHRYECMTALVYLLSNNYREDEFSQQEKDEITRYIAADDALTIRYLPYLAGRYDSSFSRRQLLTYYEDARKKNERIQLDFLNHLMKRLLTEDPPLCDSFFTIYEALQRPEQLTVDIPMIRKLTEEGCLDRMGSIVDNVVRNMDSSTDYRQLVSVIGHDLFLSAWKKRNKQEENLYWYGYKPEWKIEINLCEDPDADINDYDPDILSCRLLDAVLDARPDLRKDINGVLRKKYKRAMRASNASKAQEALILLARNDDSIAVKYAQEWKDTGAQGEALIYIAAVGTHFDCMNKLFPEIYKMEVSHAAGQD